MTSSLLRPRKNARHAKPSTVAPAVAAGGLTAAFVVADGAVLAGAASAGASNATWDRLAQCESGGNWSINTGNGYYGGLQFNLATWRGVGGSGYPHQASRSEQIARANILHDQRGFKPWPSCSRKLGLNGSNGGSAETTTASSAGSSETSTRSSATSRREAAARASRSRAKTTAARKAAAQQRAAAAAARQARIAAILALKPTTPPKFDGHVLNVAEDRGTYRIAVKHWQRRMAARGWNITVDGYFGPQSAAVARSFAADKKVTTAVPGTVDQQVWDLAWTTAVTL